jgi:hypothetical protein
VGPEVVVSQGQSAQGRRSSEANPISSGIRLATNEQSPIPDIGSSRSAVMPPSEISGHGDHVTISRMTSHPGVNTLNATDVAGVLAHHTRASLQDGRAPQVIDLHPLRQGPALQVLDRSALVRQALSPTHRFVSRIHPCYLLASTVVSMISMVAGGFLALSNEIGERAWPRAINKELIAGWFLLGTGLGIFAISIPLCCVALTRNGRRSVDTRVVLEQMPMRLEEARDPRTHAVMATLNDLLTMNGGPRRIGRALADDVKALDRLEYLFDPDASRAGGMIRRLTTMAPNLTRLLDLRNHPVVHRPAVETVSRLFDDLRVDEMRDDPPVRQTIDEDQHHLMQLMLNELLRPGGGHWYDRRMKFFGRGTLDLEPPAQARALARSVLLDFGFSADQVDQMLDQGLPQSDDRAARDEAMNTAEGSRTR